MRIDRKPAERRPARLEPLSVLPVFCNLQERPVLVAGGSEAAAWKAELLAAAGARVTVLASAPSEEMRALLSSRPAAGSVMHLARDWTEDDLAGMAFAICDAASDDEARRFFEAGKTAGATTNVIDRPAFCQVQFGSIVNRSPVVVGISTSGAAPILGQAVRRRIETVLPRTLAAWGRTATRIRSEVIARFAAGPERRAAWERFVDRCFTGRLPLSDAEEGAAIAGTAGNDASGRVTLVGAGPGDPELVTMKAVRALQSADVILFDDLVSDEVLEMARREAKRMLVGKRGGRTSCRQEDINALMVKLAGQGKHVVRLKSGDPMIFGRAGEEIAVLERAGIAVSVVPGISAGLAMASAFGISLTHRAKAQSVRFVTGHSRNGGLPEELDWAGLADPATTTLFYMGGRTAGRISAHLIDAGMSPDTSVVIARDISGPEERRWGGSLAELAEGIGQVGYERPVLIGIGAVFDQAKRDRNAIHGGATSRGDRLFA